MAAKIKKPKKLRYPKKPKRTASLSVLENYIAKCKEIDKKNAAAEKAYKKKVAAAAAAKKKREQLVSKISGMRQR